MKVIPSSSKTVTVGAKTWAALVQESRKDPEIPPNAMMLEEISAQLRQAGMPSGKGCTLGYVRDAIKRGLATEHRIIRNGRWAKVYAIKEAK